VARWGRVGPCGRHVGKASLAAALKASFATEPQQCYHELYEQPELIAENN